MIEAAAASSGKSRSARYTLLEKLGAGGQAEVWRARDEIAGVEVALKVLNPALARNEAAWAALLREHGVASRLQHPAILKVQPPYREGDFAALPMDLAAGGDLRRLRGAGYLDVVPVLIDIAQALEYAHEQGVIHRDLKPGNVLFDARGRVRIADFGVAGVVPGEGTPSIATPGLSPFTASPEQLRGEPPAISDDIYGLGALAYELLSGYPPYYPRFEVKRVLEEPVPELKPAQLMPPQLVAAVMRMLAKRPAQRQQSMREVIDDLDSSLNDTLTFDFERVGEPQSPPTLGAPGETPAVTPVHDAPRNSRPEAARPPARGVDALDAELASALKPRQPVGHAQIPPELKRSPGVARAAEDATLQAEQPATDAPGHPQRQQGQSEPVSSPDASPLAGGAESARTPVPVVGPTGIEEERIAAVAAAAREAAPHFRSAQHSPTRWDDLRLQAEPNADLRLHGDSRYIRRRAQPPRRSWPWVMLAALLAAAVAVFVVLPRYAANDLTLPRSLPQAVKDAAAAVTGSSGPPRAAAEQNGTQPDAGSASGPTAAARSPSGPDQPAAALPAPAKAQGLAQIRASFDQRLAALEARGAGVWGGPDFAAAKMRAAESVGANDAGDPHLAEQRLNQAVTLLGGVEARASKALAAQLATGDRALAAGQGEVAQQAYESARRIDPGNRRAAQGLQRVRNLAGILPLLADGENAEAAKEYARAVQDYSQALSLDPGNAKARAGLDRAHAAFGNDSYAKAVGSGFAALGAGRLDDARESFEKARTIRPNGKEAAAGLTRVGAALRARGFASTRQRAAALEAEERWTDAFNEYDAALKVDPSLVFAQQGKARAAARADLSNGLQVLIDRPERLASQAVRAEADALLQRAAAVSPSGPVLRSQIARLQILLPEFDVPVRLQLVSDNATQVAIQRVGSFGTFTRREIELKPGKYTVVGTRPGYRDVRRDVTIAPGRDLQTISVSCVEPI